MLLNVHSHYSLRYGTNSIEELIELLKEGGYDTAVITDINNSTGVLQFIKAAKENGIRGLAGIEYKKGDRLLYIGIARNEEGFRELNEILTESNLNSSAIPFPAPELEHCYVVYPFEVILLRDLLPNEFIGVCAHELNYLWKKPAPEKAKCVVLKPISFKDKKGYRLHKQLRAIDNNILLSQLQPSQYSSTNEVFCSKQRLLDRFNDFPELIRNTENLLAKCSFDFNFEEIKNKKTFTGSSYDDKQLLEKLALDGCKERYGQRNKEAILRVKKELAIIDTLGFSAYFLITWDIVRYSMSRGFYHVGRGSGANSVVAYCLKITDVCPIELDLYFERFLNPKRKSPPDFDIDFSWKDRDEVFDYIFKRYGHKHTALLGAMVTFQDKSIIRELGKVYGLPKGEIDRITRDPKSIENKNELVAMILSVQGIDNLPNLRSIHAGGVLISDKPISYYTALDLPPKGLPTTQFDMHLAEAIGFEKLDILSQRGIGHIKECVDIVQRNCGRKIDVHNIPDFKKDAKIRDQLESGNTIGCFYIESPAMRQLLKKLHCKDYPTLVAASSIIRPGVSKSGMMRAFIERHHNPTGFKHLHPVMAEQLKETYGVMVYQEDVLKVGHHFGGLDLADADVLRRLMSGKNRGRHHLVEIEEKFFRHCTNKGYDPAVIKEVWRQMESFAGYSFSKAHSASYAVESYQSLFLKTYFPLEFMVAVINNFGGFYNTRIYVQEARKAGATINLPCVNKSLPFTTIEGNDIYLGFVHIDSLEEKNKHGIPLERDLHGPYENLEDLITRNQLTLDQATTLIRVGALRFTDKSKKQLLWEAHSLLSTYKKRAIGPALFAVKGKSYALPQFPIHNLEHAYDEIELLGFPVTVTPFEMLQTSFRGDVMANDLSKHIGKSVRIVGDFVTAKYVPTVRGDVMNFCTFLDPEGCFVDTVHFPPSLRNYPLKGNGVYLLKGDVVEEFGVPSLNVEKMVKLAIAADPRSI